MRELRCAWRCAARGREILGEYGGVVDLGNPADVAGLGRHAPKRLGGRYVKTEPGWKKKVVETERAVVKRDGRAGCGLLSTADFLKNQANVLRRAASLRGHTKRVAASLGLHASLIEAGMAG